jgi:predicted nucleic acid-binding Zn ribbon protein
MVLRLPEHSHCKYCGDPVPFGNEYCNEECERSFYKREAGDKRKDNMFYIGAAISVIVIIAVAWIL